MVAVGWGESGPEPGTDGEEVRPGVWHRQQSGVCLCFPLFHPLIQLTGKGAALETCLAKKPKV